MHILFVSGEYPPMLGGVGAYTAALAGALVAAGVEVSVLTAARARPQAQGGPAVLPSVHRWGPGARRTIVRTAHAIAADWVHVQYQTAAFGMNPAINALAPARNFRLAWTYHDMLPPYLFPKAGARLRNWVTERPVHHANLVIATNQADRQRLAAAGAHNLHAIPIGSNIAGVQLDDAARRALRAQLGYGNDTLLLGYFGFLNRSKGADTLIEALAALVRQGLNAKMLMVGERLGASDPTNAATLAEVEALIAAHGLQTRVQWTGRLDDDAASAALNAVDLLLLPFADGASLRRGTLMAGLANGCAIVTSAPQLPIPELDEGRDLRYVPAHDAGALAHMVAELARDPEQVRRLRHNARTCSAQFAWTTIARRHLALYTA